MSDDELSPEEAMQRNVSTANLLTDEQQEELRRWAACSDGPWREDLQRFPGPAATALGRLSASSAAPGSRPAEAAAPGEEPYRPMLSGYDCELFRNEYLAWCAAVQLPPGHPDIGKKASELASLVTVHGGLTVAEPKSGRLEFDCNHAATEHGLRAAGVVTCVGSLTSAKLRMASADRTSGDAEHTKLLEERFEITSLVGTAAAGVNGSGASCHLHISLSDKDGRLVGGHVVGDCRVFTTAEIILVDLPAVAFSREHDEVPYASFVSATNDKRRVGEMAGAGRGAAGGLLSVPGKSSGKGAGGLLQLPTMGGPPPAPRGATYKDYDFARRELEALVAQLRQRERPEH